MPTLTRTIITPIVTEQTSSAYQDRGEYTFRVHPEATKTQIRNAIEELFNVKVTGFGLDEPMNLRSLSDADIRITQRDEAFVVGGTVTIDGQPMESGNRKARTILGVVPQDNALDTYLTVRDNLHIYGRYFGLPLDYEIAFAFGFPLSLAADVATQVLAASIRNRATRSSTACWRSAPRP